MHLHNNQSGIALLITLLLMGVLLGIGTTLLNITLKQMQLSSIAYESEKSFQAANAGVECALYYDFAFSVSPFEVPGDGGEQTVIPAITCMGDTSLANENPKDFVKVNNDEATIGNGLATSRDEQRFQFDWSNLCTEVSVYKFYVDNNDGNVDNVDVELSDGTNMRPGAPCPEGSECTIIQSRGYNVPCNTIGTGVRVVEREYTQVY